MGRRSKLLALARDRATAEERINLLPEEPRRSNELKSPGIVAACHHDGLEPFVKRARPVPRNRAGHRRRDALPG